MIDYVTSFYRQQAPLNLDLTTQCRTWASISMNIEQPHCSSAITFIFLLLGLFQGQMSIWTVVDPDSRRSGAGGVSFIANCVKATVATPHARSPEQTNRLTKRYFAILETQTFSRNLGLVHSPSRKGLRRSNRRLSAVICRLKAVHKDTKSVQCNAGRQ